jgi:curved DNA-binding protein CbpA
MTTLYDVLGLARGASPAQIESAYRLALDELDKPGVSSDDSGQIRAKAIGEAYSILSSANRRAAYDARLVAKDTTPVTIIVEEPRKMPWLAIISIVLFLAAIFTWNRVLTQRAEAAKVGLEASRAAAAASEAVHLAEIEQTRLAQQMIAERSRADAQRARESSIARMESRSMRYEQDFNTNFDEVKRDIARSRIKAEQRQEEMLAQQRANQQIYNMQRALAIPIVRH